MNEFVLSVDPGKRQDPFTLLIIRISPLIVEGLSSLKQPDRTLFFYDIVHAQKMAQVPYPQMVSIVRNLLERRDLKHNTDVLVDVTGVGEAVVDLMRMAGIEPIPLLYTGGGTVKEVYGERRAVFAGSEHPVGRAIRELHVPRDDMITAGVVLLQQKRVRLAPLPQREEIIRQFQAFKAIARKKTGELRYEAEPGEHDDYVLCYLMAAWWIMYNRGKNVHVEQRIPVRADGEEEPFNPFTYW